MNAPRPARSRSIVDTRSELARLEAQVEAMRSLLGRLMQEVMRAERRLDQAQAAQLVEVNEQLLLSAMHSRDAADTATGALQDMLPLTTLDGLTGLHNRATLVDRLAQAVAHARRYGGHCALLFVDLDGFKALNDVHGHAFGDLTLQLVAARLLSVMRGVDTVSRYGGDEFIVLQTEPGQPQGAQVVAEKILAAIAAPAEVAGQSITLAASIGIALFPGDGEDAATLIAHADQAMYRSKRNGPGGFAFHAGPPP